jgi:HK97 family phage major capsid protein
MSKLTDLIEKKNSLIADATMLVQSGLRSAEQKAEYAKVLAAIDDADEMISMLKRLEAFLPSPVATPVAPATRTRETKKQRRAKVNSAWRSYLQGQYDERIKEQRDLLTSSDGQGAAVVPQEFSGFLSETMKLYAPLFNYANVRPTTDARGIKICRVDDSTHGITLLTEGSATPLPEVDPTFSSSVVNVDLFTSGITRFSNQLLSDSDFDLEQLLSNLTSSRIGRGIEKLLTLGLDQSGTATPNNPGLLSIAQTATTTGAIASGIGWVDIISTFDALDAAYLPKAIWLMSSKTRNYLSGLKTSDGRPFFTPATDGGMEYLLGKPIVINQSLPSPTAGVFSASVKPIIFGSLYDGLQVISSDVRVTTLQERFADMFESAIIVSTRVGSASLQAGAIQALKIAAA